MGRRAVAALFSMALYCGCVYGEDQQESADSVEKTESLKYDLSDYRNFFGICWSSDTNSPDGAYARCLPQWNGEASSGERHELFH